MLYYALMCLVVGVTAGVLHLAGVAAVVVQISWVLFLIGIVLIAIHVVMGRTARAEASILYTGGQSDER